MTTSRSTTRRRVQQASAVPYRIRKQQTEFCLITSRQSRLWVFPKGIVDPGETIQQAALKEAQEEAGIVGTIIGPPLGEYEYTKRGNILMVIVFLMEVGRSNAQWKEADVRKRTWASPARAQELLTRNSLKELLASAVDRLEHA